MHNHIKIGKSGSEDLKREGRKHMAWKYTLSNVTTETIYLGILVTKYIHIIELLQLQTPS